MRRNCQLDLFPLDPGRAVRLCFRCGVQPIPLNRTICHRCVPADPNRTDKQATDDSSMPEGECPDA